MPISHWMTFSTFAEQTFFVYPTPATYSGVILNANMVAHASDGLAAFLIEKTANNSYLIDPLTHAFQHDPVYILNSDGAVKSSVGKLAESYGSPVRELVGKRPVVPNDFANQQVLTDFVRNVLAFQEKLSHVMANTESNKKYLNTAQADLVPKALVVPYFFLSEVTLDDWLPVQLNCLNKAREIRPDATLLVEIVIDRGVLLSGDAQQKLANAFTNSTANGFLIWIDQFDEQDTNLEELQAFLRLCRLLRGQTQKPITNLHGGYYSLLVASQAGGNLLSGIAHGPEFGESRGVIPVGGGLPFSKYYVPSLHARLKYRDAQRIFLTKKWLNSAEAFHTHVCNCPLCVEVLDGNVENFVKFGESVLKRFQRGRRIISVEFPTTDAKEICLKHYLQRKAREFHFCSNASAAELFSDLESSAALFEDAIGKDGVSPLRLWKKALAE